MRLKFFKLIFYIYFQVLFAILFILLIFYYSRQFFLNSKRAPGPICLPILGYLPFLNPKYPHLTLTKLAKKYGGIYGLYLGSVYTIVLSDSKLVREAFKREEFSGRAPLYVTHGIMGGYGKSILSHLLLKKNNYILIYTIELDGRSSLFTITMKVHYNGILKSVNFSS